MKLDDATCRKIAVQADCDPRTIKKALRGEPVRGMAGRRARTALLEAGYSLPPPTSAPRDSGSQP